MSTRRFLIGLLTLTLLASAAPALAGTGRDRDQSRDTERFSRTVTLGKTGSVSVVNISGDIAVTGGPGELVVIEAVKRGRTAESLKDVEIEVIATEGRVEVATKYPRETRGRYQASVHYTLTVPRGASVRLKSISGDVEASLIDGRLQADTVSGNVTIAQAAQIDGARTVSGHVRVKSAATSGTLDVGSVSGGIYLAAVKARAIEAGSVSGDVELTDVTCERVTVKSVSGDLEFAGPLAKGGRYVLQAHSGDVRVRVLNEIGFEVTAGSFSGSVSSDLPLTLRSGGDRDDRRRRRQEIRGVFGDGAAVLELRSFSGSVRITGRDTAPARR